MQVHGDESAQRRPRAARGQARNQSTDHQRGTQAVAPHVVKILKITGLGQVPPGFAKTEQDARAVQVGRQAGENDQRPVAVAAPLRERSSRRASG